MSRGDPGRYLQVRPPANRLTDSVAVPRLYTPLSRVGLRALAGLVALVTAVSGALKVAVGLGMASSGPAARLLPEDALLAVGVVELVLAAVLPWARTAFFGALLLIGDCATHVLALLAVGRPLAAAGVLVVVNLLTILLWAYRPRWLGGNPTQIEVALVD